MKGVGSIPTAPITKKSIHIYLQTVQDPAIYGKNASNEDVWPVSEVVIPNNGKAQVQYHIGKQDYIVLVYYSMITDGGEYDFIDTDELYGHYCFFDLR